jgi:RNA recognition motif. (a.k.a. RRM, RBD, or RNP domain)
MKNLGHLSWGKDTYIKNQEIDSLLDDDEQKTSETRKSSQEQMEMSYLLLQQPCASICVLGLEHPSLNCQMIWNLFSNFGNITRVSFDSGSGRAIVEYQQVEYAIIAREVLVNLNYFGT